MAPIFASPDIAALVAAFPPSLPSREQPSLIRSNSGSRLLDSRHVLQQFRKLLETSPTRIRVTDLPRQLGFSGRPDWLLASYDRPVYYGCDGQSLLPEPENKRIWKDIMAAMTTSVIDVAASATGADISTRTLREMTERNGNPFVQSWQDPWKSDTNYMYSNYFARMVDEFIKSRSHEDWSEGVDLSKHFETWNAPASLLLELTRRSDNGDHVVGEWQTVNGNAVFVPVRQGVDADSNTAAWEVEVDRYVEDLRTRGFCKVVFPRQHGAEASEQEQGLLQSIKDRYAREADEPVEIPLQIYGPASTASTVLTSQSRLDEALQSLRAAAPQEAARIWNLRDAYDGMARLRHLTIVSLEPKFEGDLPALLLQGSCSADIGGLVEEKIKDLQSEDFARFEDLLNDRLFSPVLLYTAGTAAVQDTTLRQHLEEYLGEHLRREVVPQFTATLQAERLLHDKSRKKDHDKFQQASSDAKTLSDIHDAVKKLVRKHKIPAPHDVALRVYRLRTLREKIKLMRKLPRGSDILQNLIWILLAFETDGLYLSSGKDTTRMIKAYRGVGDAETAQKLEAWRDALKAGKEDEAMSQEMRDMASAVVDELGERDPATKAL